MCKMWNIKERHSFTVPPAPGDAREGLGEGNTCSLSRVHPRDQETSGKEHAVHVGKQRIGGELGLEVSKWQLRSGDGWVMEAQLGAGGGPTRGPGGLEELRPGEALGMALCLQASVCQGLGG